MVSEKRHAFTLTELLAVMAVLGLLAGMLLPALGMARNSLRKMATQSRFQEYTAAYEGFYLEYGYYPGMGGAGNRFALIENNSVFVETLSGRGSDGGPLRESYALKSNWKQIPFYTFPLNAFKTEGPDKDEEGKLVDAFGNPNIMVVIDGDHDGFIPVEDLGPLPDGAIEGSAISIRAGVLFYSANPDLNPDWQWVYSWK